MALSTFFLSSGMLAEDHFGLIDAEEACTAVAACLLILNVTKLRRNLAGSVLTARERIFMRVMYGATLLVLAGVFYSQYARATRI